MRDLEIRGAGNLLGESQSGHIAAVGYDLYCQMVTEAVGELKGEPSRRSRPRSSSTCRPTPTCRPTTSPRRSCGWRPTAGSPRSRRAAEVDDIRTEWEDRYGPLPEPAEALLDVGYLRAECHRLGITDIQIASGSNTTNTAKLSPLDAQTQRDDAAATARQGGDVQGGPRASSSCRSPAAPSPARSSSASSTS